MKYEDYIKKSFDELVELAQNNPEQYQRDMTEVIKDYIDTHVPNEELRVKLHQLQWRIEGQLRGFKDPVARMNEMVKLFWQGVNDFRRTLSDSGFGKPG